jgi:hypothetical protein
MSDEANGILAEKITPWIELLDKGLADEPVHRHPLQVAMQLVSEEIIKVSGPATEDDYFVQDWFGLLVAICTNWYLRRYGDELLRIPETTVAAGVLIFGTFFKVEVPTNPTRPGSKNGTVDLHFTSHLLEDEDPKDWIVTPPNLTELSYEDSADLAARLKAACDRTRSIVNGLAGSALNDDVQPLAYSITTHIDNAISSFIRGDAPGKQLAI